MSLTVILLSTQKIETKHGKIYMVTLMCTWGGSKDDNIIRKIVGKISCGGLWAIFGGLT